MRREGEGFEGMWDWKRGALSNYSINDANEKKKFENSESFYCGVCFPRVVVLNVVESSGIAF